MTTSTSTSLPRLCRTKSNKIRRRDYYVTPVSYFSDSLQFNLQNIKADNHQKLIEQYCHAYTQDTMLPLVCAASVNGKLYIISGHLVFLGAQLAIKNGTEDRGLETLSTKLDEGNIGRDGLMKSIQLNTIPLSVREWEATQSKLDMLKVSTEKQVLLIGEKPTDDVLQKIIEVEKIVEVQKIVEVKKVVEVEKIIEKIVEVKKVVEVNQSIETVHHGITLNHFQPQHQLLIGKLSATAREKFDQIMANNLDKQSINLTLSLEDAEALITLEQDLAKTA
jgi:hypothetical protein